MFLGIDVSTYLEELDHGAKYYSDNIECDPLDLFRQNNVEYMRIRVWNNPYSLDGKPYLAGNCDINNFIVLAKLAISKGYKILLDLHYSDFWADPGKQIIPKAWVNLGVDDLALKVYEWTKEVINRAKKENIEISLIQIGNEITNGMLWPIGRLVEHGDGPRTNYENLAKLLKSGIKACKEEIPNSLRILHLERSYDQKVYQEFFSEMAKYNVDYDIIGASYYPYWHGNFKQLFANLNICRNLFHKDIMIMELGYAFTLEDYIKTSNGQNNLVVNVNNVNNFDITVSYPLTPDGQKLFIHDFLIQAKLNNVMGVFYWEPLWIPGDGICWASVEGQEYIGEVGKSTRNEWSNQCLFDYNGKKLPAFDEFIN